jgi:hypothetical protein
MAASERDQVFVRAFRRSQTIAKRGDGALFEGNDPTHAEKLARQS